MGIDQISVPTPADVYGYSGNNHTISTPNLAKFASEGLLFQTWYSSFHVCSPSRYTPYRATPDEAAVQSINDDRPLQCITIIYISNLYNHHD